MLRSAISRAASRSSRRAGLHQRPGTPVADRNVIVRCFPAPIRFGKRYLLDFLWRTQNTLDVEDMVNTAKKMREDNKLGEAFETCQQALAVSYKRWGEDPLAHPTLMWVWSELGAVLSAMGRFDEADECLSYAEKIATNSLGKRHPQIAQIIESRGVNLMRQGRYDEAHVKLKIAYDLLMQYALEPTESDSPSTTDVNSTTPLQRINFDSVFHNLVASLYQQAKFNECDSLYRSYFLKFKDSFVEDLETARFQNNWALVLEEIGKISDAEELMNESLRIRRIILGDDHPALIGSYSNLGELYAKHMKEPAKAEEYFKTAMELANKCYEPHDTVSVQSTLNLSKYYYSQHRTATAIDLLNQMLARILPEEETREPILFARLNLANMYMASALMEKAEEQLAKTVEGLLADPDLGKTPKVNLLFEALTKLITLYTSTGDVSRASKAKALLEHMTAQLNQK